MREVVQRYADMLTRAARPLTSGEPGVPDEAWKLWRAGQRHVRHLRYRAAPRGQPCRAQRSYIALQKKVDELDVTHPGAPPRAMVLDDSRRPTSRTSSSAAIPSAWRGGPAAVPRSGLGPDGKPFTQGSGRLELAQAIAEPGQPARRRA